MEITYYKQIQANPHFTLRNFLPLIKKSMEDGVKYGYTTPVELGGVAYSISFEPQHMKLTIAWSEDGEKYSREIRVVQRESNLPSCSGSYVYYFLCPRTLQQARVLYRVGSFFWSRRAFKAVYPLQMVSKHNRDIGAREEPYRRNGKEYYRGKLTPYGKRCIRYEKHEERQLQALQHFLSKYNR